MKKLIIILAIIAMSSMAYAETLQEYCDNNPGSCIVCGKQEKAVFCGGEIVCEFVRKYTVMLRSCRNDTIIRTELTTDEIVLLQKLSLKSIDNADGWCDPIIEIEEGWN